ncbi:MAG: cytochrome c biogenesis protein CcsA [Bacteroidia bacterium]
MIKKGYLWKTLAVFLILYTLVAGFLFSVPDKVILEESIRNLYFHVPMWFGMILLFLVSAGYAIAYLATSREKYDIYSVEFANTGIVFGCLGMVTGMVWAQYTWGEWWSNDPKQLGSAIGLLIYFAYLVLRSSFAEEHQRAKISAVYNIFALSALIPLIFVLPRMTDSLHPGNGGNPGFNAYDLDDQMRLVFYPAVLGWALLGVWFALLRTRISLLHNSILFDE